MAKEVVDRVDQAIVDNEGHPDGRLEPEVILEEDLPLVILDAIGPCIEVAGEVALTLIKKSDAINLRLNIDAMTPSRTGATLGPFALAFDFFHQLL